MTSDEAPAQGLVGLAGLALPARATDAAGSRLIAEVSEAERAERTRLADALHDDVLQSVLSARQDLAELATAPDPELLASATRAVGEIERSLRSLTTAMHEDTLARLPLGEALERIAQATARRGRFAVEVVVDPSAVGAHDALVRGFARELLTNVLKHAAARRVQLQVRDLGEEIEVVVRDDGRGLREDTVELARGRGHLGLTRLRRTAEDLGGRCFLDGRVGEGTRATVRLPRIALERQRTLEDELGVERRWSTALVAAIDDALAVVRGGRIVQVNDAFVRLLGFERSVLLGLDVTDSPFWRPGDRTPNAAIIETSTRQRGSQAVVWFRRADGSEIETQCTSQRIDDEVGDELSVLWLLRDMTERRQAEQRDRAQVELRTTIETTRRLGSMLAATGRGTDAVLDELGRLLVEHLGWRGAVLNLCRGGFYEATWSSEGPHDPLLGRRWCDTELAPYFDARHARADGTVFYVPEDGAPVGGEGDGALPERSGDLVLAPMTTPDGRRIGLISVDGHPEDRRPTDTELDVLGAVAAHAASALDLLGR